VAKIPVIGKLSAKISVSISVADMMVQIYRHRQKYRLAEYICIGIGIGWAQYLHPLNGLGAETEYFF
jgi:hypothetical protein